MSTCVVRGAQVAPTPNLQHTYYTPTSIMCGAYAPRMRDLRVECWECELNENKFYFGGKHTRIYQFMLKFFQYSQHISLRYAQVTRTWHLRGTYAARRCFQTWRKSYDTRGVKCFGIVSDFCRTTGLRGI